MSDLIPLPENSSGDHAPKIEIDARRGLILAPRRNRRVATAGAVAILLALGWGAGATIDNMRGPTPDQIAAQKAVKNATDAAAKALAAEEAQKQEIASLRGHVDSLKFKLDTQAQKAHASEGAVATLQKNLAEQKAEAAAAAAQLQARIDHLQAQAAQTAKPAQTAQAAAPVHKPDIAPAKPQGKVVERAPDPTPVASIGGPQAKTLSKPLTPYRAYVLRQADGRVAVVESRAGLEEVGAGDILPSGARVDRIERRGAQWVVVTDRGFIAQSAYPLEN